MPSRLPSPYRPEAEIVAHRLQALSGVLDWAAASAPARPWVQAVRDNPPPFWAMESLLREYPISSAEGLALMRLAEALLRVPDAETAIALTADQLGRADFDGMDDTGAARKKQPQLTYSYDMLGEGARTDADALHYLQSYQNAIESIATRAGKTDATEQNDGISIKLSALHPRYEWTQRERILAELVPRVWGLCEQAARANINLTIDAEEVDRLELSLDVFEALAALVSQHQPQWRGFGLAMQAYQTRALELIEHVAHIGRKYKLRLMCRLVKGAYWDSEIKRAQELGLPHYPVFTHKHHTDVSYLACAKALLDASDVIYPQFATHNAATIAAILHLAAKSGNPFELQRLHGMGEGVYREVLKNPLIGCRVYAPVGQHRDLLAYLVRRLLENGANSSFVHQLADESVGMEEILVSPLRLEPESAFVLPPALFGRRQNSAGLDLEVATQRATLQAAFDSTSISAVPEFDAKLASSAYQTSADSYKVWSKTPVTHRASLLRHSADALEQHMPRFCALLVKEAFKTWGDAVSEVREAVDFLRFYADEAERVMAPVALPGPTGETNELRLTARGVWVCISPWNFPLAIFMGQVAAALATGNTVLAKPAEQTPAVALEAVRLLHAAGVPTGAVQLLHGPGETVGAALVALPGIAGVVFTGSTPVARTINRALAAKDGPIVPLIAETGGINAMLVDSTALPEQVVDAVVQSAFRSAGQRCSALRLLCVHEAIADHVIEMVQGAAKELVLGDTANWATDVGPVIDRSAFDGIQQHIQRLKSSSKVLLAQDTPAQAATKLIAPHAFELQQVSDVAQEIFGPVLHVVRWSGDPLAVIEQVNALGYGLTMGIQTRIDSRAHSLAAAAHIGNVYINRNTIGAVVGVQPFDGEGLSGTGPKAGGPHYLLRFCAEQTVTVNTTAAGGNAALLAAMP